MNKQIKQELNRNQDLKYQEFQKRLIPNIENIIGVKTPILREMAKQIIKNDPYLYLKRALDDSFEEVMLQAIVIGYLKEDFNTIQPYIINFIPKINNWAICDIFCGSLKISKQHKEEMYPLIKVCLTSNQEYSVRFGIVMILNYYLEEKYFNDIFYFFEHLKRYPYYVQMAIAWTLSIAYFKFPNKILTYLKTSKLDDFTYLKTLQKIRESKYCDQFCKDLMKKMKTRY